MGLISAVKTICLQNKHIKIFASLRSEAFILDDSPASLIQNKNYTTELKYNKEELERIFINNINNTDHSKLVNPKSDNVIERFIGVTGIPHKYAKDSFGIEKKEPVFDFIWRHTFKRPREIVEIGKRIHKIPPEKRTMTKIWDTVHSASHVILQQYKNEMIPYFRDDIYNELCRQIGSNVVKKEKAEEISISIVDKTGFEHVFQSLYRLGLVGWIEKDETKETKFAQKFLDAAYYNFHQSKEIPVYSDYFLLHPSTDQDLHRYHGNSYYNTSNIVGYDKGFYENSDPSKLNHIHIGAGRVSQCLLFPILKRNASVAVIEKPSGRWGDLSSYRMMLMRVNEKIKTEFRVYHDNLSEEEKKDLIKRWINKNGNIFFYTNDEEVIFELISHTQGISFIRRSDYRWVLEFISRERINISINIYSINLAKADHKFLQSYLFQSGCENMKVIPVIADRYFYKNSQSKEGSKLIINVFSEEYGEVITYSKNKVATKLFYPNEMIEITDTAREFRYHLKKFRLLSEGIFKLEKLLSYSKDTLCSPDEIFDLFVEIQFHVLKEFLNKESVKGQVFPNLMDSEIDYKIKEYATNCRKRVQEMPVEFKKINHLREYQEKVLDQSILPNEEQLFSILSRRADDFKKQNLICLLRLFNYKASKKILSLLVNIEDLRNIKIFVSYSHKDKSMVNELDQSFHSSFGIDIIRDEKNLGYRENIEIFMKQIRDADFAFVLLTDNYLKSKYCLYELLELSKDKNYLDKMLPIIMDDSQLFEKETKNYYYNYWKDKLEIEEMNITNASTEAEIKNLHLLRSITTSVKNFIDHWIAMRLISFNDLKSENYLPILKILSDDENRK